MFTLQQHRSRRGSDKRDFAQGPIGPFVLSLIFISLDGSHMAKKMSWQAKQRANDLKLANAIPRTRKEALKQLEAKLRLYGMHQVEAVTYRDGITLKTEWK